MMRHVIYHVHGETIALHRSDSPGGPSFGIAKVDDPRGVFPPDGEDVSDSYVWLDANEFRALAYAMLAMVED